MFADYMFYILSVPISVILFIYVYFKWTYSFWKKQNVPFLQPKIPFGNIRSQSKNQHLAIEIANIYKKMKAEGHKHAGFYIFDSPIYLPIDIELIKNILTRDFNHFINRGLYYNENEPLSVHLVAIENDKWKNLRARLTPAFTTGKIKSMLEAIIKCGEPFLNKIQKCHEENKPIEIKDMVARYMTDIIGTCAFGIDCNSFKNPDAEFRKYGKKALDTGMNIWMVITMVFPKLSSFFNLKIVDKDVSNFITKIVKDTLLLRNNNHYKRDDFMQILIDMKNNNLKINDKKIESYLTENELMAQVFIFFLAGFETTSTTLTYCFYEISQNVKIQEKIRDEIKFVLKKYDGKITYKGINEMKYLDQIVNETLRKYPPIPILNRMCNKDYRIPDTDLVIRKGTKVFISSYGIQHNAEYFPDPEKFDPDRFSNENKRNIQTSTFLSFGDGPRACIGVRFGQMQVKVCIVSMIKNFHVQLNAKTTRNITFDSKSLSLLNKEDIFLDIEKVK